MTGDKDRGGLAAVLGDRTIRRILAATASTQLASGVFFGALPLAVATGGGGPLMVGVVSAALTMWWLFSVPMGALVDQRGPGPVLRVTSPILILAVLIIASHALVDGAASTAVILCGAVLYGAFAVVTSHAAGALPALVVDGDRYDEAYSLMNTINRVASLVIGPTLGATLLMVHPALPFVLAGMAQVGTYLAYRPLFADPRARCVEPDEESQNWRRRVRAGLVHVWSDRFLRAVMITLVGVVVAEELILIVSAPYFRDGSGHTDWQSVLGVVRSVAGVFAILAALGAAWLARRFARVRVLVVVATSAALCPAVMAIAPHILPVLLALTVAAVAESIWVPLVQSEMARRTPGYLMARTRAAILFVTWGSLPLTSVAGGAASQTFGIRPVLVAATVLALVTCAFGIWRVPRGADVPAAAGQTTEAAS